MVFATSTSRPGPGRSWLTLLAAVDPRASGRWRRTAARRIPIGQFDPPAGHRARRSACPRHDSPLTVGFGPSLFDDRFGLADRAPGSSWTYRRSPATRWTRRLRRRPRRPGLRRRSPGGLPCRPQPDPDRPRVGDDPLPAGGIRARRLLRGGVAGPAQPPRLPRRHRQSRPDRRRRHAQARLGRRRGRPAVDAGRHLPGDPQDPHPPRGMGPQHARPAGTGHRPGQGDGRSARWADENAIPLDLSYLEGSGQPGSP